MRNGNAKCAPIPSPRSAFGGGELPLNTTGWGLSVGRLGAAGCTRIQTDVPGLHAIAGLRATLVADRGGGYIV